MNALMDAAQQGAPFTFALLALASCALPLGLVTGGIAALRPRRSTRYLGIAALAVGGIALAVGLLGYVVLQSRVDAALAVVDVADEAALMAQGAREARMPLWFGIAAASVPLITGLFAVVRGGAR